MRRVPWGASGRLFLVQGEVLRVMWLLLKLLLMTRLSLLMASLRAFRLWRGPGSGVEGEASLSVQFLIFGERLLARWSNHLRSGLF